MTSDHIRSRSFSHYGAGPPGQMKAVSGPKLKPMDQGPLTGALKDVGFDESQVGCALSDVVILADQMRSGVQVLGSL